jgi:hypothetical protein
MKLFESLKKSFVVWVWNHTPDCAEMSRLASQALDRGLPWSLRLQMRLHHLICRWCRRYSKQIHFLHQAAPRLGERFGEFPSIGLSADAHRRILQRLQTAKSG